MNEFDWSEEVWCSICRTPLGDGDCEACRLKSEPPSSVEPSKINYCGQVVSIFCPEHVWHGQIGITRGMAGPAHCRVEMDGCLRKIPIGWLRDAEPDDQDA